MSLRTWILPLSLLGLVLTAGGVPAQAGISIADPDELVRLPTLNNLRVSGRVIAMGWRGHGRSLPPRALETPVQLGQLVVTPPSRGEGDQGWTDLVLILDGPVTVRGVDADGRTRRGVVELDRLVVPLDDPETTGALRLSLPALTGSEDAEALASALRDGVVLVGE